MGIEKLSYSVTEVEESMKDASCILDSQTSRTYKVILGRRGIIIHPSPGAFCIAFPMDGNGERICYRVWKEIIPDAFERYGYIGDKLNRLNLPYFSQCRYIKEALRMKCDGRIVPGMAMAWIDGNTLDGFLREKWGSLNESQRLTFIRDFYQMCHQLRRNGIAHGDLSCLNIMVTNDRNEIRLVDYDSLFVSSMGRKFYQSTGGAPSFQHPDRTHASGPLYASIDDDNFSQLIIALSLWVAYFDPSVTQKYDEMNLLFLPGDLNGKNSTERLNNLHNSQGWKTASKFTSRFGHISRLMKALESIAQPLSKVPSLTEFVSIEDVTSPYFYAQLNKDGTPRVKMVKFCTICGNEFKNDEFKFCPQCGAKRHTYTEA